MEKWRGGLVPGYRGSGGVSGGWSGSGGAAGTDIGVLLIGEEGFCPV